jgi:RNA ligase (TIGR02306 family)
VANSTHKVEIVPVEFSKHPNADTLSVAQIFGGYSYVGRTSDWVGIKRAAYIPPDSVVDTNKSEFKFLKMKAIFDGNGNKIGETEDPKLTTVRIKAKKLRGIISFGLMVPVPDDTPLGDDWTERLGVTHYEPETEEEKKAGKLNLGGENEKEPEGLNAGPYYDIEAARRYAKLVFSKDEPVVVTEKVDGSNVRVVFHNDRLYIKSRNNWKRRTPCYAHLNVDDLVAKGLTPEKAAEVIEKAKSRNGVNGFWLVIEKYPGIAKLCQENPGTVVFGEIFGGVNRIKYRFADGNRFAAFDVFKDGRFLDFKEAYELAKAYEVPWVPCLGTDVAFDFDKLCEMAEGTTLVEGAKAGTIREGIVICPAKERWDNTVGRVKLKFVSGQFLEKS